ncbi:MAG: hypothetical protein FJ044_04345 [Candidatus Cloacimonetes bacterium]|nr:hypothetical protein [Candidatus Cloacimonadota bacterium]
MVQKGGGGVVERALRDAVTAAITFTPSKALDTVIETLANGRVLIFGESGASSATHPRRTDIWREPGLLVKVHKNPLQTEGMFAAASRFNLLEVYSFNRLVGELGIKTDPTTSQFNPIYVFQDGDEEIGKGYGQQMDLRIASGLLGVYVGGPSDYVSPSIIAWIRDKAGLS